MKMEMNKELYKSITLDELVRTNIENGTVEIVEDMIRGYNVSVLSGDPKAGKTAFALELAYKVSKGEPVYGKDTFQKGVLYISLDTNYAEIAERVKKMGFQNSDQLSFYFNHGLKLKKGRPTLEELIINQKEKMPSLGLVIVDMFYNIVELDVANEYSNSKTRIEMDCLNSLAQNYNVAILILVHNKKNTRKSDYRNTCGATSLNGSASGSIMILERDGIGNDKAVLSIGGRNVREQVLKLSMNTKTMSYSVLEDIEDEPRIDEEIAYLRNLMIKKLEWSGTMEQLCSLINSKKTASAFGKVLKSSEPILKKEGITVERQRTTGKRIVKLRYEVGPNIINQDCDASERLHIEMN